MKLPNFPILSGMHHLKRVTRLLRRSFHVDVDSRDQQLQKILVNQYQSNFIQKIASHPNISDAGFRCYSQFEEDGVILYILSSIGMKTKKVVEMCCGHGSECMAANLIINHGYLGYLFDGNKNNTNEARSFFNSKKDCLLLKPVIKNAWIKKENVNQLLTETGATGEVDLLSLDLDGNDYHIWETISAINPRLCVFETHDIIPSNLSLTIPYDPDFNCWAKSGAERDFRSVSLLAMTKLSERKGYRLIGSNKHGFNVFFLRNDIATELFPQVSIEFVHDNPWTQLGRRDRWPLVKKMNWIEV